MPIVNKQMKSGHGGDVSAATSSNLWVGNLSMDVMDADLMEVFGKHGVIDSITSYPSRSYAFIYFKRVEDAMVAKDALQGYMLKGNALKIEFAKPAKPSRHLWVGGISSSVTKETLEEELLKFGKIENFKFLGDRNTIFVDYAKVEDASAAVKSLNGKQIGADHIRVDFLRSHPLWREQLDSNDLRDTFRGMAGPNSLWILQDSSRSYSKSTLVGNKSQRPSQSFGGRREGQPSKVLWVGYPPSVKINDEMLFTAMILYGEIEGIKSVPSRNYTLVQFRSVEEARQAKESLQGRLFSDPRITIMFSNSELAPKDFTFPYPALRGPVPDMFMSEALVRPPVMDTFGHNHSPHNFPGAPSPSGLLGAGATRPFGPRGGFDPLVTMPKLSDPVMLHNMTDSNPNGPLGSNLRGSSPSAAVPLPSHVLAGGPPHNTTSSGWDAYEANHIPREPKRSKIDGSTFRNASFSQAKGDDYVMGSGQPYGVQQFGGGLLGMPPKVVGNNPFSPSDVTLGKGCIEARIDRECIWRGVIAKGGTPVCCVRCIPIGKGIEFDLPEVINCSARTGLDMLTKHYTEAVGFEIVFFLPDSEEDFASYTEFLRYLCLRNRAGVAKFDGGTTFFLVPPSDFLTKVLNVRGPERLYGVVLKFPQVPTGVSSQQPVQQSIASSHMLDRQQAPLNDMYDTAPQKQDDLPADYDKVHEDSLSHQKVPHPLATESHMLQSVSQIHASPDTASVSRAGFTLTPELIATLASLIPSSAQQHLSFSSGGAVAAPIADGGVSSQSRRDHHQSLDQTGQSFQQIGNQLSSHQQPLANCQTYHASCDAGSHLLPETSHNSVAAAQTIQHYPMETVHNTAGGYGQAHVTALTGSYGLADFQQPKDLMLYSNQVAGVDFSLPENALPGPSGEVNSGPLNQADLGQHASHAVGEMPTDSEVDKNQRYQSTLEFAASLLMQMQQQQQQSQSSSPMGQGHNNQ